MTHIADTPASKDGRAPERTAAVSTSLPSPRNPAAAVDPRVGPAPEITDHELARQRLQNTVESVSAYLRSTGGSPTIDELADEMGMSPDEIVQVLDLAIEQGKVMAAGVGRWSAFGAGPMTGWSRR